jgi:lysophospholipase L1-like esterase
MKYWFCIFVLSLFACNKEVVKGKTNTPDRSETTAFRYLALGDSYTIGTAIGVDNSYASMAADSLRTAYSDVDVELRIIAQNGWTTGALQNAMDQEGFKGGYDAVSLLIGVNDQFIGASLVQYKQGLLENINSALAFADGDSSKLFILSIPDYGVTPYGRAHNGNQISASIDVFNALNREVADSQHLQYVNITDISRQAATQPDLVAQDGLHFSAKMHVLWLARVYPQLESRAAQ